MGKIIWLTGLSGSGKSTISELIKGYLSNEKKDVLVVDGDIVRNGPHKKLDFSPNGIKTNNLLLIDYCRDNKDTHDYIIVSVIAPFEETRRKARRILGEDYIEIFINASLEKVIERDVKGHYQRALNGEIENFIGISAKVPYEKPVNPDFI